MITARVTGKMATIKMGNAAGEGRGASCVWFPMRCAKIFAVESKVFGQFQLVFCHDVNGEMFCFYEGIMTQRFFGRTPKQQWRIH